MKVMNMMRVIFLTGALLGVAAMPASGAENVSSAVPAPTNVLGAKSAKSHNFEDLLVQGKYHFSGEAVVTVEDDKVLDSLLGIRKDFKDRLETSSGF